MSALRNPHRFRGCHFGEETCSVFVIEEELPGEQLKEQAAQRPNIRRTVGPDLLPPVVCLARSLTCCGYHEHLRAFDALRSPVSSGETLLLRDVQLGDSEI